MSENNKTYLDTQAKILALEYLVKNLIWNISVMKADEKEQSEKDIIADLHMLRGNVRAELERATVPTVDATTSDHLTALASDHVDRILVELIEEFEADIE